MTRRLAALLLPPLLLATAPAVGQERLDTPRTRAERTSFRETTPHPEAVAFVRALGEASERVHATTFGRSGEGRPLPLAVVGAPAPTAAAARATGKTRVLVLADIHAGEVAGKEASLRLLRALAGGAHSSWTDSLVLLFAPVYNADGDVRIDAGNRPRQHGPLGGMGTRANAAGLDLNRDFVKADAPETRALLRLLTEWDPHLLVDLHVTNGTFHGYHLTYAPPLNPNTPASIDRMLRERWLPEVTARLRAERGMETWHYGNVPSAESPWAAAEDAERGWYTFDHRPRFGTTYAGLRNRFAILSEAYSYLTFRERVESTEQFVGAVLDWAAAHAGEIRAATDAADRASVVGERLAVRSEPVRSDGPVEIVMGRVAVEPHPETGDTLLRRLPETRVEPMPAFVSFRAAETERAPAAYLLPAGAPGVDRVVETLAAHGVEAVRLDRPVPLRVERFRVERAATADAPFQGHRTRTVDGRWEAAGTRTLPAGSWFVPVDQPLGRLAFTLLEPRSDDGLATWNAWDASLAADGTIPLLRTDAPLP